MKTVTKIFELITTLIFELYSYILTFGLIFGLFFALVTIIIQCEKKIITEEELEYRCTKFLIDNKYTEIETYQWESRHVKHDSALYFTGIDSNGMPKSGKVKLLNNNQIIID